MLVSCVQSCFPFSVKKVTKSAIVNVLMGKWNCIMFNSIQSYKVTKLTTKHLVVQWVIDFNKFIF
jgi:hypothetical protein